MVQRTHRRVAAILCLVPMIATAPLVACAGPSGAGSSSNGSAAVTTKPMPGPVWCRGTRRIERGDSYLYVGEAEGVRSTRDAEKLAFDAALLSLTQEIGVTVASKTESRQSEVAGRVTSAVSVSVSARSEPITLVGLTTDDRWVGTDETGVHGCVRLAIPRTEYDRVRRAAAGRTVLVMSCSEDDGPVHGCSQPQVDVIVAAASQAGLRLTPALWAGAVDAPMEVVGLESNAADALRVRLAATFAEEIDGEFYARATGSVDRVDTTTGKVIGSDQVAPVKGGAYSRDDAMRLALGNAAKEIAAGIANVVK